MNSSNIRIAVEGCGHGALDDIYASVEHSAKLKGWPSVDLVIICGDFQAVRNAQDLNTMSVPFKYRAMGDFWKYYSGQVKAPYLTIFIGGNHEASAHLRELFYGGWAAPNIYYVGAANVLNLGPLRIAGMSGIYKGFDYRKPHHERLPFTPDDCKTAYHVRSLDVRKLLHIRSQIDVGLSHDWPSGIEWLGDHNTLFRIKPGFREDANSGHLGSQPATLVLDWLRPPRWFSGHMHFRYAAIKKFEDDAGTVNEATENATDALGATSIETTKNDDEIYLDLDMDDAEVVDEVEAEPPKSTEVEAPVVSEDIRAQLPASFAKPAGSANSGRWPEVSLPRPTSMSNTSVEFLALDKITPNRDFLQLLEITPHTSAVDSTTLVRPLKLSYDPEWLAITRAFSHINPTTNLPTPFSSDETLAAIDKELNWVKENLASKNKLTVPENFELTAPIYDPEDGISVPDMPLEYNNSQTVTFCTLLDMPNYFYAAEEEQLARQANAPPESRGVQIGGFYRRDQDPSRRGGGHRGDRGRDDRRGRGGRGGFRGGRGRGFDRGRGGRGRGSF